MKNVSGYISTIMFCLYIYDNTNVIGYYKYFVLQWARSLWLKFKSPIRCLKLIFNIVLVITTCQQIPWHNCLEEASKLTTFICFEPILCTWMSKYEPLGTFAIQNLSPNLQIYHCNITTCITLIFFPNNHKNLSFYVIKAH